MGTVPVNPMGFPHMTEAMTDACYRRVFNGRSAGFAHKKTNTERGWYRGV